MGCDGTVDCGHHRWYGEEGASDRYRGTVFMNNVPIMPLCATTWIEGHFSN